MTDRSDPGGGAGAAPSDSAVSLADWASRVLRYLQHDPACTRQQMKGLCSCGLARFFDAGTLPAELDHALSAGGPPVPARSLELPSWTLRRWSNDELHDMVLKADAEQLVEEIARYVEHLRDEFLSTTESVAKIARLIRERFGVGA